MNCCSTFRSAPPSLSAAQMQPIFTGLENAEPLSLGQKLVPLLGLQFLHLCDFPGRYTWQIREQTTRSGSLLPVPLVPTSGTVREHMGGGQSLHRLRASVDGT